MANKKNQTLRELYGENYYCSICDKYFQDMSGLGRHYHTKQHLKNKDRNPTYVELTMETINFIPFKCECSIVLRHENRVKHRKSILHKNNMTMLFKKQTVVEEVKQNVEVRQTVVQEVRQTVVQEVRQTVVQEVRQTVVQEVRQTVMQEVKQCKKTNIYITPIAKKDGKNHFPKRDFELQMENLSKGSTKIYWDGPDPKWIKKQPKVGDYFIFWLYKRFINIHKIQNVFEPSCRLPEWTDNVGHSDRLVVELSRNYEQIKWEDYINKFDGRKVCMGTLKIKDDKIEKNLILNFLTQEF